ncbi:hypothetical protein [Pelosinus sp. IPA-1]|uniref:hypothetical protein n=1 Tax=Pelosinus sp. IPA-1 TaxID=3029569 RepID=UPI00243629B5|nr:hypothetical protein [Pelosinus sp. IPA-1]GMA99940.1 hypothetical protein PIPA1_27400 [Pelosinus sp. IPA-1]
MKEPTKSSLIADNIDRILEQLKQADLNHLDTSDLVKELESIMLQFLNHRLINPDAALTDKNSYSRCGTLDRRS